MAASLKENNCCFFVMDQNSMLYQHWVIYVLLWAVLQIAKIVHILGIFFRG
jgi:hypothetical protein